MRGSEKSEVTFGCGDLSIEDITAIAHGVRRVSLDGDSSFSDKINRGVAFLDQLLSEEGVIYGVTTGYGDSCTVPVPLDKVNELPVHLYRFHGCGMGATLSREAATAVLAVRLASLVRGFSGVSLGLLQRICDLINEGIIPVIPEEGSVGASGDLTPLSYIAAVLCGERSVIYKGQKKPTREVFESLGIEPLVLRPKEGLALMNGTAVMTGLACLAFERAGYLVELSARITSMAVMALQGNAHHFDEQLFKVKPHIGQGKVAERIRKDLHAGEAPRNPDRLQDRYSLRCAPHVIGVLADSLSWMRQWIEVELNSTNDNPIIDAEGEHVLHGGHFYGGHIAFAMDGMKNAVASVADLLDRQMAMIVDSKFNNGLAPNLTGATEDKMISHGLKAVQIAVSSWTAEALHQTMPLTSFSRSTECHNQDKVSMGTIAARSCLRTLELSEQVCAALLIATTQALQLRIREGELTRLSIGEEICQTMDQVNKDVSFLKEDRPLEDDLRRVVANIQARQFCI